MLVFNQSVLLPDIFRSRESGPLQELNLVVLVVVVLVLVSTLLKKAKGFLNTRWIGMKLDMIILDTSPHRRSEPDF